MVDALQINFALWGMIGCAACNSVQLIQFLTDNQFRNLSDEPP